MYGRINYEYILPPRLALTVLFVNHGAQPLTFTIADVNSLLGDFAARPATLTLAPGEPGSLDPMLSNLDAISRSWTSRWPSRSAATGDQGAELHRPPERAGGAAD